MAITNRERVGRALDLLQAGLGPFVERELHRLVRANRVAPPALRKFVDDPMNGDGPATEWDVAAHLKLMLEMWREFREALMPQKHAPRKRVLQKHVLQKHSLQELIDHRNLWAHQKEFDFDDAYRAIDIAHRLLTAVSAEQAADVESLKKEMRFGEQGQDQRRRQVRSSGTGAEMSDRDASRRHGGPEYPCPIPGCTKVFHGTRGGWDAHVASWRMHPDWHPDVTDGEERKRRFRREYPRW